MDALLLSFGVIFVAELGDKSQLMALAFAARYRALPVLVGITVATAVVHAASVAVGMSVGAAFPTDAISVVAGVAFLGFGLWTLRGDSLTAEEEAKADRSNRSAVVAASVAFFLAELGDKTMLATTWPPPRGRSGPGWDRRSAWWPPTRWPSWSAASWGAASPPGPSRSGRRCRSSPSAPS